MLLPPGVATLLVSYAIILVNRGNVKATNRRTLMAVAQATLTVRRKMTEGKFLRLPDAGCKWELVDGEAKEVATGHEHEAIGVQVAFLLKPFARGRGVVARSQSGFRMVSGHARSPDVSFTRKECLPDGLPAESFEGMAPDLAIEIISPSK